jgi:TPR repeat protein
MNNEDLYLNAREDFRRGQYGSCLDKFLRLSQEGDARSTFYAAAIFDKGGDGVRQDAVRARALYEASLKQSFLPASALSLALMLYQGRGGGKDFSRAMQYYNAFPNNAFAVLMVGTMRLHGYGCVKDEDEALRCFQRAWSLGHPLGLKNASIMLFRRGKYFQRYVKIAMKILIFFALVLFAPS